MHNDLKSFKQKPIPKILQKPLQFWKNPKNFQKPQKLGQEICNASLMSEKASYQIRTMI